MLQLINDYNTIKTIYQLEIGKEEFPPSTLSKLGNAMSAWDFDQIEGNKMEFWRAVQEWQSVCYTLRAAKQSLLSANRNERMIEDACSRGGPLELPIHLEECSRPVRAEIEHMEVEAQSAYEKLQLDPTMDFQAMLSLPDFDQRVQWLAAVVSRERARLERVATQQSARSRR